MPATTAWWERAQRIAAAWRPHPDRCRACPALPALGFFLAGALPCSLLALGYAGPVAAAGWGAALLLFTLWLTPRWLAACALLLPLGLACGWWHARTPWQGYLRQIPGDRCHLAVRGIVVETGLPTAPELAWAYPKAGVLFRLQALRLAPGEAWQPSSGLVLLRGAKELRYGQELEAEGALRPAWSAALPGAFDYRTYLRTNDLRHVLEGAAPAVRQARPHGWRRTVAALCRLRETLLLRLLHGIPNDEDRQIVSAMTLGFCQSFDTDARDLYLRSGMIHLFAISGMNVGMLYVMLMTALGLARVPFTLRHHLAPWLLLLYALATGAAPSAMRAWLMLAIWSHGRGLRLPAPPVNAVLTAALLLLAWNPSYLFQSGFQFSFVIVLSLLLGWQCGHQLWSYLGERLLWVPFRARPAARGPSLGRHAVQALTSMTCAWLGGLGLSAFYNGLFLPACVPTNLGAGFLSWAIMVLSLVKLLAASLPDAVEPLLAGGLALLAQGVRALAAFSAEFGSPLLLGRPTQPATLFYHAVLLVFFLSFADLRRLFARGLALLLTIALLFASVPRPAVSLIVPEGNPMPVLLVRPPAGGGATLVNFGDHNLSFALGDWLGGQGIDRLATVLILDNRAHSWGGGERLLASSSVDTVLVLGSDRRGLEDFARLVARNGARWRPLLSPGSFADGPLSGEWSVARDQRRFRLLWQWPDGHRLAVSLNLREPAGSTWRWQVDDAPEQELQFAYADRHRVFTLVPRWE